MSTDIDLKPQYLDAKEIDSPYNLIRIPRKHLADIWAGVLPLIEKGMPANPNMKLSDITEGLIDQSIQLWLVLPNEGPKVITAAFLTSIERDKGEWVLSLYGLGGVNPKEWVLECHMTMHEYARHEDCKRVRMCGRPAWQRILPGYAVVGEKQGHLIYERAVD